MKKVVGALVLLVVAAAAFIYSGAYDVAADEPHWVVTQRALELLRARSVQVRSRAATPPGNLDDPQQVARGAAYYVEMCEACHLAPGMNDTSLRQGLNPKPPALTLHRSDPQTSFWVVKHGVKMTAMPAWGASHADDVLWSVIAFVQKLPDLNAAQYRTLVERAAVHRDRRP